MQTERYSNILVPLSITRGNNVCSSVHYLVTCDIGKQESLALANMARDDPPASSMASKTAPASSTAAAMRGKVGSEFET